MNNMAYKIFEIEKKSADWVVVSLVDAAGDAHEKVSINKVSKKGDVFPNFDALDKGTKVEGRIWESDAGKKYLFAPKGGAKAPYKQAEQSHVSNASNEEHEYPISAKLETLLNKFTGMQIDIQIIKELLQLNKKAVNDYPDDKEVDSGIPF